MPTTPAPRALALLRGAALASLVLSATQALAQGNSSAGGSQGSGGSPSPGGNPAPAGSPTVQPSPYYIGGSQAFTHDSNVYGIPFGPSDNYSSTSLLAGFDQPFGRQHGYGSARVSANRYQDETRLNNTSYGLSAGLDWATIWKLSGNLTANIDQSLSPPTATAATPVATRNLERRRGFSGMARWGGDSLLTLESRAGYSRVDFSAPEYVASESENKYASLGVFYQPGTRFRAGLALRLDRTHSPDAVQLPNGSPESNEIRGRNVDLLLSYNNGNALSGSGRVSYTRQKNSDFSNADFSGLTGSVNVSYRATGKINLDVGAARDAGYNTTSQTFITLGSGSTTTLPAITTTPVFYENNQVTNSIYAGASYAATAKIGLTAAARYSRARVVSSAAVQNAANQAEPDVVDTTRGFSLGANYAFSRALTFNCSLSRDRRELSGATSYKYTDDGASCSAQFLWR